MLTKWWTRQDDDRILCELCPRACRLNEGDRGFCFVRSNHGGKMVLDTYGKSTGFCIDPIEKKPLNHFLPGTPVLSFGTAGCNLGCKFCQNWDISKSREVARLSNEASPEAIAHAARESGCRSVAYTYNDPVIWAEYAIDTAAACRELGIQSVAVTAGYITPEARPEFFGAMDAANIDLKAFSEDFYFKLTSAHLDPVLDTIRYACNETDVWVELTNLIIPRANEETGELQRMCDWVLENVGPDVPVHFTAFHPDFRMTDRERTPHETLIRAYDLARSAGLRYVYVGNVHDVGRQSTYCPSCSQVVIERDWHELGSYALDKNCCGHCGFQIAGRFESAAGTWGRRRQPIKITPISLPNKSIKDAPMKTTSVVNDDSFSEVDRQAVHAAASRMVVAAVQNQQVDDGLSEELASREIDGVYVTLKRGKTLRGCCGVHSATLKLRDALTHSANRTATNDPRMTPISTDELAHLDLSVSILGGPRSIGVSGEARVDAVEVGKHGLRIQLGKKAGLLLPSVAREWNWNSRQFLDAVCRKAGLPAGAWLSEDADLKIFDGIDFGGPLKIEGSIPVSAGLFSRDDMIRYQQWATGNLNMLIEGGTPMYYATGVSDATVQGVALQVIPQGESEPINWLHFVIRDGVPLQSTLFQLTQTAAQTLSQAGLSAQKVDVVVMSNAIHHGTGSAVELQGVDCQTRGLLVRDSKRFTLNFDRGGTADAVHADAMASQRFQQGTTQTFSVVCDCSSDALKLVIGLKGDARGSVRAPAVAGRFYPADDAERDQMVDGFLAELAAVKKQVVKTAMVPHAGLRFSGRIAADVWRRIELPETVIVIGPKHTADGVNWAVAPHSEWQLSANASMPGDLSLATQLADAVSGFELDAKAHAMEHGIEVQLPVLHRIAPKTKVVGVAMTGGTIDELRVAAKSMALWMKGLDKPPLLMISSDMNHFADDQENRRRDRLALEQLQANDPEQLLKVCRAESISMCGQVPAAFVLMTLAELGTAVSYQEIDYATSADVSGDKSRVVGYAGLLF